MSAWITIPNRIVQAIGIQIQTVDTIGLKICKIINRHESSDFRIVVSGLQVVQFCFFIVIVATVTNGVEETDSSVVAVNQIAPNVIGILCHKRAACIVNPSHVALEIESVIVGIGAVMDKADAGTRLVEEVMQGSRGSVYGSDLAINGTADDNIIYGSVFDL